MKFLKLFPINLMLFGEGPAADTGSAESAASESEVMDNIGAEEEARKSGSRRRTKSEPTVVYGKQPSAQGEKAETDDNSEKPELSLDEQFETMIRGDFKEAYDKKVQGHIKHRLGDVKKIENENQEMKAVIDVLAQKYGSDKPSEILAKLEGDRHLWEDAAEEAGLTVEQYRHLKSVERENLRMREEERERNRLAQARRVYDGWMEEAKTVAESYPDFNLAEELKNPDFQGLLRNNIPMKKAYETIHLSEIVQGVSEFSAKRAEENAVLKIQNRKARPKENIASSSSGVVIKDDPSKFTAKDRAEIIKRAARGEIITL